MDLLGHLIPCFGTCMMVLALMALMLFWVYSYIVYCSEVEEVKARKAEEEVKRVRELFDRAINSAEVDTLIRKGDYLGEQLEAVRVTARKQKELEELDY